MGRPGPDGEDEVIALVTTITDLREAPAAAQSPPMIEQELRGYLLNRYAISALIGVEPLSY